LNETLENSIQILIKLDIVNFKEIRPVRTKLFHTDRQKDWQVDRHKETNNSFSKICERASKYEDIS